MPKLGHILRELYDTEIEYVNALERTVHIYLNGLLKQQIPNIKMICYKIFGNIQDILHFHQDIFLPRLEEAYHSAGEVCLSFDTCKHLKYSATSITFVQLQLYFPQTTLASKFCFRSNFKSYI